MTIPDAYRGISLVLFRHKYRKTEFHLFTSPQPSPKRDGELGNPEAEPRGILQIKMDKHT